MSDPRPLPSGPLHFVGIGGAGMSALAFVLASRGQSVSGSDPGIPPATQSRLESVGCTITPGPHAAANVPEGVAALIVTDAVKGENPEVTEAGRRGIPIFKRPEALGSVVNSARTAICIAGTHGKTTTTGMVASILIQAGLNPTVLIGGDLPLIGGNARAGDPDLVVAESCEAYGGLDWLKPSIAIILNMEPDHLDFHGSEEAFLDAFRRFALRVHGRKIPGVKRIGGCSIFACAEDEKLYDLLRDMDVHSKDHWVERGELDPRPGITFYGLDDSPVKTMKYAAVVNPKMKQGKLSFDAYFDTLLIFPVELAVAGTHNALNALGAISACMIDMGLERDVVKQGIESFTGTGRRFEKLGETSSGVVVIDDYAHHPTEIRATLQGARQAYPDSKLVAIFQPHLPSRTRDFLEQFASALADGGADAVYLTDIYLAREPKQAGLIELLAGKVPGATLISDRFAVPERLKRELQPGDVAIFMGAGNIREQAEAFLAL